MPREKVCRECGTKYSMGVQFHGEPKCPQCGSSNWEYADLRVRQTPPSQEPLKTPLPGSTADYLGE